MLFKLPSQSSEDDFPMQDTKFNFGAKVDNESEDGSSENGKDKPSFFNTAKLKTDEPLKKQESGGMFKLDFEELNQDFRLPEEFKKIKKLGTGAYGKVMQVYHNPTKKNYAVKRFEEVFSRELRAKRLLRELNILKSVKHPCLNKL